MYQAFYRLAFNQNCNSGILQKKLEKLLAYLKFLSILKKRFYENNEMQYIVS